MRAVRHRLHSSGTLMLVLLKCSHFTVMHHIPSLQTCIFLLAVCGNFPCVDAVEDNDFGTFHGKLKQVGKDFCISCLSEFLFCLRRRNEANYNDLFSFETYACSHFKSDERQQNKTREEKASCGRCDALTCVFTAVFSQPLPAVRSLFFSRRRRTRKFKKRRKKNPSIRKQTGRVFSGQSADPPR